MNAAAIDDLKDFIDQKIDNAEVNIERRLNESLTKSLTTSLTASLEAKLTDLERRLISKIDQKGDEIMTFVGDALDTSNNSHDIRLKNHERRITKLERKLAH